MAYSPFHAYLSLSGHGLSQTKFLSFRFQQLRQKLRKQKNVILQKTFQTPIVTNWKSPPSHVRELLTALYSRWVEVLTGQGEVKQLAWRSLLQTLQCLSGLHKPITVLDAFIDASRLLLTDAELLWCWEYRQEIYLSLEGIQQRSTCSNSASALANQIITQWQAHRLEFHLQKAQERAEVKTESGEAYSETDAKTNNLSPSDLAASLARLFVAWHEHTPYQSALVAEVQLLQLLVQFIVAHPLRTLEWKMLLLHIDTVIKQQLCQEGNSNFTEVIELLLANVERFDLIRSIHLHGYPCYAEFAELVGNWLIIFLFLKAHDSSHFAMRLFRLLDGWALCHDLSPHLKFLGTAHRKMLAILHPLRKEWEMEELVAVIDHLNTFLFTLQQGTYLLQHLKSECHQPNLSSASVEQCWLDYLFKEILRLAWLASVLTSQLPLRQALFRRLITLYLGPDREEPLWQKYLQIHQGLQQLTVNEPRSAQLLTLIRPLLDEFSQIIEDNLNFPANWFGTATALTTVASQQPGCHHLDIVQTLRQLAQYRRLYGQTTAVSELKFWYLTTILLPQLVPGKSLNAIAIYNAFAGANKIFQSRTHLSPPPLLLQILLDFIEQLPEITCGHRLILLIPTLANEVAKEAKETVSSSHNQPPLTDQDFTQLQFHNTLVLTKAVHLFSYPIENKKEVFTWWWQHWLTISPWQTNSPLLEANLTALYRHLQTQLVSAEAKKIDILLDEIYYRLLGTNRTPSPSSMLSFTQFELEGLGWHHWFGQAVTTAQEQQGLVETISELKTISKQFCDQNEDIQLHHQFQTFIDTLLTHGEVETAVQRVQPLFDTYLRSLSTEQLERSWRRLLCALSPVMTPPQATYWATFFQQSIFGLRQVGLGRRLQLHATEIARELTSYLNQQVTLMNPQLQKKCERDLLFILNELSQLLRNQCATLVALNIGRYLIECVIPFITYSAHLWQMLWMQMEMLLSPKLDRSERLALTFWISQLEALSTRLPNTHILGQHLFGLKSLANSSTVKAMEQANLPASPLQVTELTKKWLKEPSWRHCISGFLTVALTPSQAPISGRVLLQRLWLSSSVLYNHVSIISWPALEMALSQILQPWLEEDLNELLAETYAELVSILLNQARLEEMQHNLPRIGIACALLSQLPYAKIVWQNFMLMRASSGGNISPTPCDSLVCQIVNSDCLNYEQFKQVVGLLQEAHDFNGKVLRWQVPTTSRWSFFKRPNNMALFSNWLELSPIHQEEMRFFFQTLARHIAWHNSSYQFASVTEVLHPMTWLRVQEGIRQELLEMMWLHFDDIEGKQQAALFNALAEEIAKQYGTQHPLALHCRECVEKLWMITLAIKLLTHYREWASAIVTHWLDEKNYFIRSATTVEDREAEKQRYFHNLQRLLYRLGITLVGLRFTDLTTWYQQRFGKPPVIAVSLFSSFGQLLGEGKWRESFLTLPKELSIQLSKEEGRYLKKVLAMLFTEREL
jgi:hypothetical protein